MLRKQNLCKAILLALFMLLPGINALSQIPNPKFTLKLAPGCPTGVWNGTYFNAPTGYNNLVVSWRNPTNATPEYYHGCNPNFYYSVPARAYSPVIPPDDVDAPNLIGDKAFSGVVISEVGANEYREYISVRLQSALIVGQTYTLLLKFVGQNMVII